MDLLNGAFPMTFNDP